MMEYRVPSQEAEILFRLCPSLPEFEWLKIQVDGSEVGQIGRNNNLKVRLPLGRHIITSDNFWGQKTSPLPLSILNAEDIEITIEPAADSSKLQFVIESKLPVSNRINERNLKAKKLAWDIGRQVILRKTNPTQLYFDMANVAFPYALRFLIDLEQQNLKVYASRRQELVLYYSQVCTSHSYTFPGLKIENGFEHTFFRSDGEFLGSLSRRADKWIISSRWWESIAEILEVNKMNENYATRDHYLQSAESNLGVLAYKKLMPKNVLQFHNINFPRIEDSEILLLAFVTFSALTWNETPVNAPESILIRV